MSLSGLDAAAVGAAADAVSQAKGGWFLLHYTSRDVVELLSRGTKGINELREAAEAYYTNDNASNKQAPLFGMLDFRRRKVLIKLVPEEASRLVKARVQVHWTSVTAHFADHDSALETSSVDKLSEPELTAQIELHSSSGRSSAGSHSAQKPTLDAVCEEGAEGSPPPASTSTPTATTTATSRSTSGENTLGTSSRPRTASGSSSTRSDQPGPGSRDLSPLSMGSSNVTDYSLRISELVGNAAATSAALQRSMAEAALPATVSSTPLAPVPESAASSPSPSPSASPARSRKLHSRKASEANSIATSDGRASMQSVRPSTANEESSLYDFDFLYKPKAKLGPRLATASNRLLSKSSNSAALPSGLRSARTPSSSRAPSLRPQTRDSSYSAYKAPPTPPIPEDPPQDFTPRPKSSANSVKSLPTTLPKTVGMTPEKARLMRFRDMYKRKGQKGKESGAMGEATSTAAGSENASPSRTTALEDIAPADSGASSSVPLVETSERSATTSRASTITACPTPSMTEPCVAEHAAPVLAAADPRAVPPAQSNDEQQVSTDEDSGSMIPVSSPVSLMDSTDLDPSTRATSVNDEMDDVKPDQHATEAASPEQDVQSDDEASQSESESSTPRAVPLAGPASSQLESMPHKNEASTAKTLHDHVQTENRSNMPFKVDCDTNASETDGEHSYDEDMLDELDEAEVQEALSVSVNKSPIIPLYTRRPSTSNLLASGSPASVAYGGATPSPLPSPLPMQVMRKTSNPNLGRASPPRMRRMGSSSLLRQEMDTDLESKPGLKEPEASAKTVLSSADSPQIEVEKPATARSGSELGSDESESKLSAPNEDAQDALLSTEDTPSADPGIPSSDSLGVSKSRMPASDDATTPKKAPSQTARTLRSPSAGLSQLPGSQEDGVSVAKRRNLGSGVANKIALLQRNFSQESTSKQPTVASGRKTSGLSLRTGSMNDSPVSRDSPPPRTASPQIQRDEYLFRHRAMSKGSISSFKSEDGIPSPSPRDVSHGSVGKLDQKRFTNFNNTSIESSSKPETVQVKATIIRTGNQAAKRETNGLGLHHPNLDITLDAGGRDSPAPAEREKAYVQPRTSAIPEEPSSPTLASMDKDVKSQRPRLSISSALGAMGLRATSPQPASDLTLSPRPTELSPSDSHSSDINGSKRSLLHNPSASGASNLSLGLESVRRPSTQSLSPPSLSPLGNGSDARFHRSMSSSSLGSSATDDGDGSKRKGGRTSRMFKRLSNSMSSIINGSSEGTSAPTKNVETVKEEKWASADLGTMNVQLPETLLWKRRHLEIDTAGFLLLKTAEVTKRGKTEERKFHLNRFAPPFAPDMDRMEMPFSVLLDFREDGGTLQVAADSAPAQARVLRVLSEAHHACTG